MIERSGLPWATERIRAGRLEHGNALLPAKVTRSYESEETCVNDHRNYSGNRRSSIEDRIEQGLSGRARRRIVHDRRQWPTHGGRLNPETRKEKREKEQPSRQAACNGLRWSQGCNNQAKRKHHRNREND